jgi:cytochrome c oxidase assembly protein subunit 15
MVGGVFYEHGHRMVAQLVGMMMIALALWTWRADPRRWMRRLGFWALAGVIVQGILGGLTVLFFLPRRSPRTPPWRRRSCAHGRARLRHLARGLDGAPRPVDAWARAAAFTAAVVYTQLVLGALMRHRRRPGHLGFCWPSAACCRPTTAAWPHPFRAPVGAVPC